ncbi:uncharacterized protein [Ptychodera flava]|uniref:uncharacterized protein n=1 Tax=Ptychodera flava TaxID=63121 RepID=UPI00396AAF9C
MTLRHFLQHYEEKNWYIVSLLPNEMRHEVEAPACLFCGNFQHNIQELNFWMSSGGTASIIHYDADHNIHCLLAGRKDFMMIDPYYNRYLDLYKPADAGSGFTSINVDSIDMVTFPELSKVQWIWTTLLPGDCIYIPSKYVHQVRSYGRSISVTTLFTTHGVFNQTDCHNFTYNYSSLADVDVMWTYEQGDKTIDIGYGDVRVIKDFLLEELEDGKLTKDIFAEAYQTITAGRDDDDEVQSIDKVWSFLDEQGKGFVTKEEILAFDREKLKKFSRMTTPPAGPLGEYIVSEDKMEELLKMEEEQDSQIRAFEGNEMLNQGATGDALQSRGQHEEL